MRLKHNCILIAFLYCWSNLLSAQPVFTNKTSIFKKNIATRSVQPGGVMDIDGDLVDDLVILDKGTMLKTVKSHGKYFIHENYINIIIYIHEISKEKL